MLLKYKTYIIEISDINNYSVCNVENSFFFAGPFLIILSI